MDQEVQNQYPFTSEYNMVSGYIQYCHCCFFH